MLNLVTFKIIEGFFTIITLEKRFARSASEFGNNGGVSTMALRTGNF